jgi:SAM-dependent methyltransferase
LVDDRSDCKTPLPWVYSAFGGPEYLEPSYYDQILKPYMFLGRSDLDLLEDYVSSARLPESPSALEIGPGTGRATEVILRTVQNIELDLLDQSRQMLDYVTAKIPRAANARAIQADAVTHLLGERSSYDLIFSLWSLSHSIHQNIARFGEQQARMRSEIALQRLFGSVLKPSGRFFLIHFDSTSEEQTISLRQRRRLARFLKAGESSPSQRIIESILLKARSAGRIHFQRIKLVGEPIVYSGIEEALEVFMNFHMEGIFNRTRLFDLVLSELAEDLRRFQCENGTISIRPACIIYSGNRRP